ncbi:MAG: class I SAM-dependent methyltransferase [Calditrichia bacterium]|nr:class I SAM-dependent methyltransferase [Calditrichia bacterium]
MKFGKIEKILKNIPHTPPEDGKILYDFIIENKCNNILELGFENGTSTCYMAAALDEIGSGKILTIDRKETIGIEPDIHALLKQTNLEKYVEPIYAHNTYIWELMKIIEEQTETRECIPIFDFCFIDGAHTWDVDGFAFFLIDKLLKPGYWVLFDDLNWKFAESHTLKNTTFVQNMPEDEKKSAQIERVFTLLVSQHPNFINHKIVNRWGWAQKKQSKFKTTEKNQTVVDLLYLKQSIIPDIFMILRKMKYKLKHVLKIFS